jgi:hypothetical protein
LLPSWSWVRAIDTLYVLWFFVVMGFLLWASWSQVRRLRQRALVAFLLLTIGGATLAAWAGASAGPCYFSYVALPSSPGPYDELIARLDVFGSTGTELYARRTQRWLWALHASNQTETFSGVSAMPSFHVGIAALVALVAWQQSRVIGALLAGFAVVIQLGSVILAWHYAVDGYIGALLAVASWVGAKVILRQGREQDVDNPWPTKGSLDAA